jgi:hypothetical protein
MRFGPADTKPAATISGSSTQLDGPQSLAVDASGDVLVADGYASAITAYAPTDNGDVPPLYLDDPVRPAAARVAAAPPNGTPGRHTPARRHLPLPRQGQRPITPSRQRDAIARPDRPPRKAAHPQAPPPSNAPTSDGASRTRPRTFPTPHSLLASRDLWSFQTRLPGQHPLCLGDENARHAASFLLRAEPGVAWRPSRGTRFVANTEARVLRRHQRYGSRGGDRRLDSPPNPAAFKAAKRRHPMGWGLLVLLGSGSVGEASAVRRLLDGGRATA